MLSDLVDAEPEAKTNPSVQAAYVALDNMEAEELEAISAESGVLYKEQQGLMRELAKAKHAHKIAAVRRGQLSRRGPGTGAKEQAAAANKIAAVRRGQLSRRRPVTGPGSWFAS